MEIEKSKFEKWCDSHPVFTKAYVPFVLTLTFIVALINALTPAGGGGK